VKTGSNYLKDLNVRFNRLAIRERALVAFAAIVGVTMIGSSLLVDPQLKAVRSTKANIEQTNTQIATLGIELAQMRQQVKTDPDADRKAELAALREKLAEVSQRIESRQSSLVPPDRVSHLLETLLRRNPALQLLSLKSLPPVSLLADAKGSSDGKATVREFDLYRHGVEVRIAGSYADLHAYLLAIERHDQKLLWGEVRLAVEEYPRAQMVIVVHTLSSEQAWLKI
jgi:MSHA biogenesis protein MshJ